MGTEQSLLGRLTINEVVTHVLVPECECEFLLRVQGLLKENEAREPRKE
jgi:hypothetical protein